MKFECKRITVDIDAEDYWLVGWRTWHPNSQGYAVSWNGGRWVRMHRLIMDAGKGQQIDHINRVKLDNRKANLRFADNTTQRQNTDKLNVKASSRHVGVSYKWCWNDGRRYERRRPWQARIKFHGEHIYLGFFATELEAAKAYNEKARELYGECARLNDV
jgi:hypothetical protein